MYLQTDIAFEFAVPWWGSSASIKGHYILTLLFWVKCNVS